MSYEYFFIGRGMATGGPMNLNEGDPDAFTFLQWLAVGAPSQGIRYWPERHANKFVLSL